MNSIKDQLLSILEEIPDESTLVAVSKTKPNEDILEAYKAGQKHFGENKVQELVAKTEALPKDIHWHMIGHLQRNKVKYIAPFVYLIHGVDTLKLLREIDKQGEKNNRIIDCLLQVHIASEETKFGFDPEEIIELVSSEDLAGLKSVRIRGLMGMATNTLDTDKVAEEFRNLKRLFDKVRNEPKLNMMPDVLSIGMSSDYKIALLEGSNMVRIGSSIFGSRNY